MRAVVYEAFNAPPQLKNISDPTPEAHGVVVKVMATGACRSDWHGWVGHDADVQPHCANSARWAYLLIDSAVIDLKRKLQAESQVFYDCVSAVGCT